MDKEAEKVALINISIVFPPPHLQSIQRCGNCFHVLSDGQDSKITLPHKCPSCGFLNLGYQEAQDRGVNPHEIAHQRMSLKQQEAAIVSLTEEIAILCDAGTTISS